MCSIHDAFPSHHSCVACNLQENVRLIERFLLQTENVSDVHFAFTTFLLLLYLVTERMQLYLEVAQLPEPYRLRHFGVIQEVRHWANFLKHPKWFMLALHPQWAYDGDGISSTSNATPTRVTIDTAFVKDYYRHEADNPKLDRLLARNEDVVVLFPNPVALMTRFSVAQQKLVQVINENDFVRESLESRTKGRHQPHAVVEIGKRRPSIQK
jgi:hypothetical protein